MWIGCRDSGFIVINIYGSDDAVWSPGWRKNFPSKFRSIFRFYFLFPCSIVLAEWPVCINSFTDEHKCFGFTQCCLIILSMGYSEIPPFSPCFSCFPITRRNWIVLLMLTSICFLDFILHSKWCILYKMLTLDHPNYSVDQFLPPNMMEWVTSI